MKEDLAPHPVYNGAFGGSITAAVLEHSHELVIQYAPKTVVFNCGNNDIAFGLPEQNAVDNFIKFAEKVRKALPDIQIIVM